MNTFETLLNRIDNAPDLDFGDIINRTVELFKQCWLQGFILVILIVIVVTPLFLSIYMPMFSSVMEQVESGGYNPNDTDSLMQMQSNSFKYSMLAVTFVISFIGTGLISAYYRILQKIDFKKNTNFIDYFYFFKIKYLGKIFAIAAFSLLIGLLNLLFELFLPTLTASMLNIAIALIFSVYTALFVVFFAFNPNLEASDIFVLSFKLGSKKWLLIFGVLLVTYIISFLLGIVACGVGLLFTISAVYIPIYLIYKDIFGFNATNDIDKIGLQLT